MNAEGIRVWALTWGEILDNALHRLKFVRQHLDYQPSAAEAIRYLRETHAKYLPDVPVAKNADEDEHRDESGISGTLERLDSVS